MSNYKGIDLDPSSKLFKDNLINALLISQNELKDEVSRLEHSQNYNEYLINEINLLSQDSNSVTTDKQDTSQNKDPVDQHSLLLSNIKTKLIQSGESIKDLQSTKQQLQDKDYQISSMRKENEDYKHILDKTVRKLDSSFAAIKKYIKYIEQKDAIIKGKEDLISDYEQEISNLKSHLNENDELQSLTQSQLNSSVDKYMETLNQLNTKELNLFNNEQERIKMKKKVEELESSIATIAEKEKCKIERNYQIKLNESKTKFNQQLDQIDKEKAQIIKFYEDKITEIERDHVLTVDNLNMKHTLIIEEKNIYFNKEKDAQNDKYKIDLDSLRTKISSIEQERDEKYKNHTDEIKTLNDKIDFQTNQIRILTEQNQDEKNRILELNNELKLTDNTIKDLEQCNDSVEREKSVMVKDIEILETELDTYKTKLFQLTNKDRLVCLGSTSRE